MYFLGKKKLRVENSSMKILFYQKNMASDTHVLRHMCTVDMRKLKSVLLNSELQHLCEFIWDLINIRLEDNNV